MKLLFIVNPISGGIDKEPFLEKASKLCHKYDINFEIFKTTGEHDKENALEVIEQFKPDKVVSVGGDGTTLLVAKTLLGSKCPMGIIPLGSANGMATELFVNPDPLEALKDLIMSPITSGLDMLLVNDKYHALHIGDAGINASIVSSYDQDNNRGMVTYAKYFIEELATFKPFNIKVKSKEKNIDINVFMAAICNARKYGTGVPLNHIGNPMDGKFEIVLIERIDAAGLIKAGLAAFNDKFYDAQISQVIQTEEAELIFDEPRVLQLDGEVIGSFEKLQVKILKDAIQLVTTNDNNNIND